jgi:hypothetical protein
VLLGGAGDKISARRRTLKLIGPTGVILRRLPAVQLLVHFPVRGRDAAYGTVGILVSRVDTTGVNGVVYMSFSDFAVNLTRPCERSAPGAATAIVERLLRGTELLVGHYSLDTIPPGLRQPTLRTTSAPTVTHDQHGYRLLTGIVVDCPTRAGGGYCSTTAELDSDLSGGHTTLRNGRGGAIPARRSVSGLATPQAGEHDEIAIRVSSRVLRALRRHRRLYVVLYASALTGSLGTGELTFRLTVKAPP